MFTTGSKLFLGGTVLSIVAAVVVGVSYGGQVGLLGAIGLASAALAFAVLAGVNLFVRDCNVPAMQPDAATECAAAQQPAGRSMWPLVSAVALGLLVVGAETEPAVFKVGVVLLLAAAIEWMVQGWSERASADPAYNDSVRKRILNPIEYPVLAAIGLGLIIYSFSRIMLWIDKEGGPVIFVVIGVLVITGGAIFAARPSVKTSVIVGVCAVAGLGIVSTGAVMAIDGQRAITEHPSTSSDTAICDEEGPGTGEAAEIDHRPTQTVAARANLVVTVSLRDGKLTATELGLPGDRTVVTLGRSTPSNIMFRNFDDPERRFTVRMGAFTTTENGVTTTTKPQDCTQLVENGGEQMLTVEFPKPSFVSEEPYQIVVPGVEGQQIEIVVP